MSGEKKQREEGASSERRGRASGTSPKVTVPEAGPRSTDAVPVRDLPARQPTAAIPVIAAPPASKPASGKSSYNPLQALERVFIRTLDAITAHNPRVQCLVFCMFFAFVLIVAGVISEANANLIVVLLGFTFATGIGGLILIPVQTTEDQAMNSVYNAMCGSQSRSASPAAARSSNE